MPEQVVIGDATLILGDCLEIMPTLHFRCNCAAWNESECLCGAWGSGSGIDVVTDPPYGLNYAAWDADIPAWLSVARATADVVVFTTAPTTLWDYPRPDWLGAYSRQGATTRNALGGFCHWTPVLVYGDAKVPVDFMASNDSRAHLQAQADGRAAHPCPKPINVMAWMCKFTSGAVLDPFMGSGTTGVACAQLGRKFIGIEIERKYFEVACQRIEDAYRQERLFA